MKTMKEQILTDMTKGKLFTLYYGVKDIRTCSIIVQINS